MKKTTAKINPKQWYSLVIWVNDKLFPWCNNIATYRAWIQRDRASRNKLKAVINGKGVATKYHIKGENIIKFIAAVEDGSYHL